MDHFLLLQLRIVQGLQMRAWLSIFHVVNSAIERSILVQNIINNLAET
jgi:hypothetical protein